MADGAEREMTPDEWFARLPQGDEHTGGEGQCERCKQPNPLSWFVASDIWNHVMRRGDRAAADRYGFCCPTCFIELAREAGINPPAWELSIPTEAET